MLTYPFLKRPFKKHLLKALVLSLLVIINGCSNDDSSSPEPDTTDTILLQVLDIAEANSINRLVIDWETLRQEVLELSDLSGRRAAISRLLTLLDDNHSFYILENGTQIFADQFDIICSTNNVSINANPAQYGYVKAVSYTHLTLPTNREV